MRLSTAPELLVNPARDPAWRPQPLEAQPWAFHTRLGVRPTRLVDAAPLAAELDLAHLWLKVEDERLGLPSFKVLGASWAVHATLAARDRHADPLRTLLCATDGNHGRAVAATARRLGLGARVLVPAGTAPARIDAIAGEGAQVEVVAGDYDAAVARSAELAAGDAGALLVSDTSWPGYEEIPARVAEGYATILREVDEELARRGAPAPDAVLVPVGVGALAQAVVRHLRARGDAARVVCVEPLGAACALASARAGQPVTVPGPHDSIMAGLNCGSVSRVAWPDLRRGADAFAAIPDAAAEDGVRRLAALGIEAGECSGGTLGAATALLGDRATRAALGVEGGASALVLLTEGVTDPEEFRRIVGRPPQERPKGR